MEAHAQRRRGMELRESIKLNQRGELEVPVYRERLLEVLRSNRSIHAETFQKAMKGYTRETIKELEQKLADVKAGKEIQRHMINVAPACHTDEYDEVIGLLEMSDQETLILDQSLYRQYVKDDWGWKQSWVASTSTYT